MLNKLNKALTKTIEAIVVLAFLAIIIIVTVQVFTRFLTDDAVVWSEELSRFSMIWMVLFAAVLVHRDRSHIRVDAMVNILPIPVRCAVVIFATIITVAFFLYIIVGARPLLVASMAQMSPAVQIPMTYIYIALPVCLFLDLFYIIAEIVADLRNWKRGDVK